MPTIVNSGNFKNGMVPDVIGARDSVVDLVDGWIDRDGEVRKRGAKIAVSNPSQPAARPGTASSVRFGAVMANSSKVAITVKNNVANPTDRTDWFIWNNFLGIDWNSPAIVPAYAGGGNSWTIINDLFVNAGRNNFGITPAGWVTDLGVVNRVSVPAAISASGFDEDVFADAVEAHAGRLFLGIGNALRWTSTAIDPAPGENQIDSIYPGALLTINVAGIGRMTDLHSLGESLIIVCENGVLSLRGDVATDGSYLGARLDTITNLSGAPSFSGSCKSNIGVVWANRQGLWVTNGSSHRNLVDNVALSAWSRLFPSDQELVVSSVGNRITVQDADSGNTFVYHIDGGYIIRQGSPTHSQITEFRPATETDILTGTAQKYREIAILANPDVSVVGPNYSYDITVVDWNFDFDVPKYDDGLISPASPARVNDPGSTTSPRLKVLSQPLDPGYPFTDNRLNQILISGFMRSQDTPADPSHMNVSLVGGRGAFVDELEQNVLLEYGFDQSNLDTTQRIGLEGNRSTPATRILIEEVDNTDFDPAHDISIYGIGAEFLEDFTYGNDS